MVRKETGSRSAGIICAGSLTLTARQIAWRQGQGVARPESDLITLGIFECHVTWRACIVSEENQSRSTYGFAGVYYC